MDIPQIGLILGQQTTLEVQFIFKEIERQGHIPIIIDTSNLASKVHIEYHVIDASLCFIINKCKVPISQISGVYWANVKAPIFVPDKTKSPPHNILESVVTEPSMDVACLMQLLFEQTQINWVNSFAAVQFHRLKPKQLSLAHNLGANIPATYIGNCPLSITTFLDAHPDSIVKPIFAGGHTKRLPASLANYHDIAQWAQYPLTLQAYVPGDNIRTYIVGQFMVSAKIKEFYEGGKPEIVSDYREASTVTLAECELPIAVKQLSVRIMRAFHLQYTAIDWRLSPTGEYYFLEANPAPLFALAQRQLGVEIDRAIVDLMFS
jgi:glutathione synthase/RimK-type ligase-like ATP-grasp enzyme